MAPDGPNVIPANRGPYCFRFFLARRARARFFFSALVNLRLLMTTLTVISHSSSALGSINSGIFTGHVAEAKAESDRNCLNAVKRRKDVGTLAVE